VTSQLFEGGSFGGVAGADAMCGKMAAIANLPGFYRAWISDRTSSPAARFTKDGGPYVLLDGSIVARSWMELVTQGPRTALSVNELGGPATATVNYCASHAVWTNTASDGTLAQPGFDCNGWSSSSWFRAAFGNARAIATWTDGCRLGDADNTCRARAALYCFQQ
jgi:hypothetical protein